MAGHDDDHAEPVDISEDYVGAAAPDFRYRIVETPAVDRRLDTDLLERAIRRHVAVHVADQTKSDLNDDVEDGVAGIGPDTLLEALLVSDRAFLDTVVPTLLRHSVSLIVFYRAIVRPIAERLGDLWCDDEIDFVKVEVVSMRLRLMCNQLVARRAAERLHLPDDDNRHVLLAHASGDRHTLGFSLAEAFFRDAGWSVAGGADLEPGRAYYDALAAGHFSIVALAITRDDACDPTDLVTRSRAASANPHILVCLGGVAVSANPERYLSAGADIVARDAPDAVRQAEEAIAVLAARQDQQACGENVLGEFDAGANPISRGE